MHRHIRNVSCEERAPMFSRQETFELVREEKRVVKLKPHQNEGQCDWTWQPQPFRERAISRLAAAYFTFPPPKFSYIKSIELY